MGIQKTDFPDMTIREDKGYVAKLDGLRRLNGTETGEIISIVTNSGGEGNYTIGNRSTTAGWLEWAKPALVGKNVLDLLPAIMATNGLKSAYGPGIGGRGGGGRGGAGVGGIGGRGAANAGRGIVPGAMGGGFGYGTRGGGTWPNYYTATAEIALWDVLGKTVNRPIYKLLGGTKDRLPAYASSQHLPNWEDFGPDVQRAKEEGYLGYKIHPGQGQPKTGKPIPRYVGHMEEIKLCRKTAGDTYILAHDPVQAYNLFEAQRVGRLLDELDYAWYEDPIRTVDLDGLVELNRTLDLPLHIGEFLFSVSEFAEYIQKGGAERRASDRG